jgi:hypothetical protein
MCTVQAPHWPTATAEAWIAETEFVAQRIEQRHVRVVDLDHVRTPVHVQRKALRHSAILLRDRRLYDWGALLLLMQPLQDVPGLDGARVPH